MRNFLIKKCQKDLVFYYLFCIFIARNIEYIKKTRNPSVNKFNIHFLKKKNRNLFGGLTIFLYL